MTVVNVISGEIVDVTESEVRRSVEAARRAGATFFEEICWQIENQAWLVYGYESWDEMRDGEYADMGVVVPRADRPEIVARMRRTGLTQRQISEATGVSEATVRGDLNRSSADETPTITNARGQQRPAAYTKTSEVEPPSEPSRPTEDVEPTLADSDDVEPDDQLEGGAFAAVPQTPVGDEGEPHAQPPRPPSVALTGGAADMENAVQSSWALTRAVSKLLEFEHTNMRAGMRHYWSMASAEVSPVQRADVTPGLMRRAAHGLLTLADEWE